MRRTAFGIVLMLGFLQAALPTPVALAQEKDNDAVTTVARKRFQEGVSFFDQRRFEEARAAFLQAYALKRHPAVLLNLAQSEVRSGHVADAARHFASFLRESTSASSVERTEAEKGLQAARAKLGRIQVNVSEPGAEILIDGESVGVSPLPEPVDVSPGTHSVEAKHAGRSTSSTVVAPVGKHASASLFLDTDNAAPPAVAPISAPPPATPGAAPPPPSTPNEATKPPAAMKAPSPSPLDTETAATQGRDPFFRWVTHSEVGWFSLGLAVAGLGVMAGGMISFKLADNNVASVADSIRAEADRRRAELDRIQPPAEGRRSNPCAEPVVTGFEGPCSTLRDNVNQRNQDRNIAIGGAIAAGVGVTTLVTGYLLSSGSKKTDIGRPIVTPTFSPHQTGLSFSASF
jgi:hypothetical protein